MLPREQRIAFISACVAVILLFAYCGKCFISAWSTGAEIEANIEEASAELNKKEVALVDTLVYAVDNPFLKELPPAEARAMALHWRPVYGHRYAPGGGGLEKTEGLENIVRLALTDVNKAQITKDNLIRDYKTVLATRWTGTWLRLAGFPRAPLK